MKKIITGILSAAFTVMLLFGLTACYVSKPDTMENLVGTYELTSYTRKLKDAPEGTEATDKIKENGIVAYLIVKDNGTGYYVYKDNNTEVYAKKIKITYTYDDEDSSRIKEINYYDGSDSSNGDGYPGKGFEHLGLTFGKKDKKLDYSMPAIFGRTYSQSVAYKKVSDKSDLSYASSKLKTTLVASEYEMNGLGRFAGYGDFYSESVPYVYYICDFHPAAKTADVYYMLKSDETAVVKKDQPVSWTYTEEGYRLEMTVGETTLQRNVSGFTISRYLLINFPETETAAGASMGLSADTSSVEELIAASTNSYNEQKAAYEEYMSSLEN